MRYRFAVVIRFNQVQDAIEQWRQRATPPRLMASSCVAHESQPITPLAG
jgi:hypothetical protein